MVWAIENAWLKKTAKKYQNKTNGEPQSQPPNCHPDKENKDDNQLEGSTIIIIYL